LAKEVNECKALHDLFQALNLDFVEQALERSYGRKRTGRHPRSLLGQFKTELLKRVARIENYDELHRLLQNDEDLRMLCDVKEGEKPYHPSTLSRFRKRIGPEAFQQVMAHCVKQLDRIGVLNARIVALDATFIKAYSRRNPSDSRHGLSDSEAGLRKQGGNVTLGYGVHLAVDTKSEMPLAVMVEPANVNEKKAAPTLLKKTIKRRRKRKVRHVVADSQYSSQTVREEVKRLDAKPVIPYPRNQAKGRRVLRVDRKFRSRGPASLRRLYRKRSAVERVVSRLKTYFGLRQLRTRGLRNVLSHVLLCVIALLANALSAIKQGLPHRIRSSIHFTKLT
jgi:transposase